MQATRYVCTHCGRRFEAEEREILECPGCFWSTSVKKEEDLQSELSRAPEVPSKKETSRRFSLAPGFIQFVSAVLTLALFAFAAIFFRPGIKNLIGIQKDWAVRLIEKLPRVKPEGISLKGKGKAQKASPSAAALQDPLTPEEKNLLERRLEFDPGRPPSEEEKKVLGKRASFQTGWVEKLPSQAWTIQSFKERLAEQEKFYKVPLPRSYKNKLYDHFEKKYAPGAEAFKNGDLLQARNLWVESLAFPIYANNVEKHRGVVLTMLRPFITDTLSKIGVINGILIEQKIREKEKNISESYERLLSLVEKKSWKEALNAIAAIEKGLDELARPERIAGAPAPYPASVNQADEGIAATLFELLQVPPPALADAEPLHADILAKRKVLESFIPERLHAVQEVYNEARDHIQRSEWAEAEKKLRGVDLPLALAEDAEHKIRILKKLQKTPDA